jgi:hypothetical protein
MSNHAKALVPLESWSYSSPERRYAGNLIDIGLMAEALIYYDQILLNITNQPQLAEFINWFVTQKKYGDLISLFQDGTIKLYDYSFATAAILDAAKNTYMIMNIQDPIQEQPNTFEQRFLYHPSLNGCFKNSSERKKLYKTLRGKVTEVKAKDFGPSIENARRDYQDTRRKSLLLQAFVDEVYPTFELGTPPTITATVEVLPSANITIYNIDFEYLKRLLGPDLNFNLGTPLTGIAHCNRLIWSAAQEQCDLYLGNPMANLVGDKLYESHLKNTKIKENIGELNQEVDFPDIRKLVNDGKIGLKEILEIRKKAKHFRVWLQSEGDRDRNAIIAYHNETAKQLGISTLGRKTLRMFGILGFALAETYLTYTYADLPTALITGAASTFLIDVASKLEEDWKPVVFGNWVRDRIEKVLKSK